MAQRRGPDSPDSPDSPDGPEARDDGGRGGRGGGTSGPGRSGPGKSGPGRSGIATRNRILDAAARLMGTIGLAGATTKEIARAAGCSEAALYKYFTGKEELFTTVLRERLPPLAALLAELGEGPGDRTTEQCLADVARQAVLFYEASMPIGISIFADPAVLARHRAVLLGMDQGPHKPLQALTGFLRGEQTGGRIRADADPAAAAALLLGACYQRAFLRHYLGDAEEAARVLPEPVDDFARALAHTVTHGIA